MNFQELKNTLAIKNGVLTILNTTFKGAIADLLDDQFKSMPLIIDQATITEENEGGSYIEISGKSDLLNVADRPVVVRLSINESGEVHLLMRYQLREDSVLSKNGWKFSNSFPDLPAVMNYNSKFKISSDGQDMQIDKQEPFLDSLYLYNTYFLVSSQEIQDSEFDISLKTGINFASKMKPKGNLGVLENTLGIDTEMTLYGLIRIPKDTDKVLALYPSEKVWNRPDAPGIHLQARMDADFTFGKLVFNQAYFRIYSPCSDEWAKQNDSFKAAQGYTGVLSIPSAGIELDLNADLDWGLSEALLYANCEGISLGNLAHLADVAGSDGLTAHLPSQLQDAVSTLESIELTYLSFMLEFDGFAPNVTNITFDIGMPNLNWQVWDDHFEVDSISCRFTIDNPFFVPSADKKAVEESDKRSVKVRVMGNMEIENVPLTVLAESGQDFVLYGQLDEGQTLPLNHFMNKFLPDVPAPGDLSIDRLMVTVVPGKLYSLNMAMGVEKPWTIPVGPAGLTISDVMMNVKKESGKNTDANFSGMIALSKEASLFVDYAVPGEFLIKGKIPKISLRETAESLLKESLPLPGGLDFSLPQSTVLIKEQGGKGNLQLVSKVAESSYMALELKEKDGKWGMAAGISLVDSKPSSHKGLEVLAVLEEAVDLQDFALVVSTFKDVGFTFPNMEQFGNSALTSANVPMPKVSGGLVEGLNIYAKWRLDTEKKEMKLLKSMLGLDPELAVTLQLGEDPAKEARMFVSYDTTLAGHHPLSCQFGLMLQNGQPELFLLGKAEMTLHHQKALFEVAMSLVKGGFYFSGSMQGTLKFDHLQLSNLALAMGFNWAGIPSLGVAATLDIEGFESSMAVFFDSTDPSKSLLAGAISDISLKDVVLSLAKAKDVPDDIEKILSTVSITGTHPFKVPLALSDELDELNLPAIAEAFLKHGKITIPSDSSSVLLVVGKKGHKWNLTDMTNDMRHYELVRKGKEIVVSENAQLYMAPNGAQMGNIVYPQGFFLNGRLNLLGMKWTSQIDVQKNKGISVYTNLNKALVVFNPQFFKLSDSTLKTGPTLSLSSFAQPENEVVEFRKPHLYLNGSLTLSGLTAVTYVRATSGGFAFDVKEEYVLSKPGKVLSGKIKMQTDIHGSFESITNFSAGGDLSLHIAGKLNLGHLNILGKEVANLGKISLNLGVEGGLDMGYNGKEAYVTFHGAFEFQNHKHKFNLKLSAKNADLTKAGHYVLDEFEKVMKQLLKTAEQFANAVKNGVLEMEKGAEQMAHVLKNAYKKSADEAMKLVHDAGKEFDEIADAFQNIYGSSAKDVAKFMKGAGADATKIAKTMEKSFKQDAKAVAKTLKSVGHTADDIAKVMKHTFKLPSKEMAKTLKDIGSTTEDMSKALKGVYGHSAKDAAKVLKDVGSDAESVTKAMKSIYKLSTKDAGNLMKDTFGLGKDEMKKVLKGAGYAAKDVENFASSAFKSVGKVFKKLFG